MIEKYLVEVWYLKKYIRVIILALALSYSVFYFLKPSLVFELTEEDNFFEWLTAISLFFACAFCFILFFKTKNIFFLLLSLLFFFGAGEEISWGQRILGFKTPEMMGKLNVQKEFNFHNLEIFNTADKHGNTKSGLARLFEVNFLFRLFMMVYGIVLPFFVFHIRSIRGLTEKLKLPVPPIAIGVFFLVNWVVFRGLHVFYTGAKDELMFVSADSEIFECLGAFILLIVSIYFYRDRQVIVWGNDIKNYQFIEN